MRKLIVIFLALLLSSNWLFSQMPDSVINVPVDPETKEIIYKEVKEQQASKSELYNRANDWFRSYYPNPAGVTKIKNLEKGLMTGEARFRLVRYDKKGNKFPGHTIQYTITIDLKDNKYRLTISNFNVRETSNFPLEKWLTEAKYNTPQYIDFLNQIDVEMKKIIESFHVAMSPKEDKKDEW